ncbi:MAG: NAD(P)H-binding protein [Verrucomicrobiae bacterium]|nr:NAD(P)H-binding protein [Verrucomicrobiae bacterium]
MRILLIGCGYTVSVLAARLRARGDAVSAVVRTETSATLLRTRGLSVRIADCRGAADARHACSGAYEAVVFSLSAGGGDARQTYVDALRHVLDALEASPPRTFLFAGSASVYGRADGGWAHETMPPEPVAPAARILLEAEELVAARCASRFSAAILRFSAIYGPGRAHFLDRLRHGEAILPGRADTWMNRIYRDDAAAAIERLLLQTPSETGCAIFNATDDEPARQEDVAAWICGKLGRPPPRFDETAPPTRRRAGANRRLSNARLRATGWAPKFPNYREGFGALLALPAHHHS